MGCAATPSECGGGTCWPCRYAALKAERDAAVREVVKLSAPIEEAKNAVATLRNRDRTTHRGLQWAYDLAERLDHALSALEKGGGE